jgi:hypothetical protein
MEPIHVPAPPKQAFNKHRRVSDLIRKQVVHFKHIEQKLPEHLRAALPQHHVVTEEDAARYIAPMTELLMSLNSLAQQPSVTPIRKSKQPSRTKSSGLSLAASAERRRARTTKKKESATRSSEWSSKTGRSKRKKA